MVTTREFEDGFVTATQVRTIMSDSIETVFCVSNDGFENDSDSRYYFTVDVFTREDGETAHKQIHTFASREMLQAMAESIATVLAK